MPIRYIRLPNVLFTRKFSFRPRPLQALAQTATATESRQIPAPPLRSDPKSLTTITPNPNALPEITSQKLHPLTLPKMQSDILHVDPIELGDIQFKATPGELIDEWELNYAQGHSFNSLRRAAEELSHTDVPVAFPTETVYGLGADATRSSAVRAIFAAKGRPADNPLIVHIHSLSQLRALLRGKKATDAAEEETGSDPIPEIYKPLIERFWPGPLTIILPNPESSVLAQEVTAGLTTFGARMPRSILALSLMRLAGVPLAGPSANASTRPSPTAAEHVFDDLNGRIHTIIDGGPCEVGVESTVVDGLTLPPTILRPGGVTVEQLKQCPGWENVVVGYKDKQEGGAAKPRAPGMKYRHYSPKAEVVLFEAGVKPPDSDEVLGNHKSVGIIRTKSWKPVLGLPVEQQRTPNGAVQTNGTSHSIPVHLTTQTPSTSLSNLLRSVIQHQVPHAEHFTAHAKSIDIWEVNLGTETDGVARGLFSALRELDKKGAEIIFVEGIDDRSGDDIAAAVMNRLRKAAEIRT